MSDGHRRRPHEADVIEVERAISGTGVMGVMRVLDCLALSRDMLKVICADNGWLPSLVTRAEIGG